MLFAVTAVLQQTSDSIGTGELVKYVLLGLITLMIGAAWRDSRETRDGVRSVLLRLDGSKDQPGLAATVAHIGSRLETVEEWQLRRDVEAAERERSYGGVERRSMRRRELDQKLLPEPPIIKGDYP